MERWNKRWQRTKQQKNSEATNDRTLCAIWEQVDACVAISTIFAMVIYGARVHSSIATIEYGGIWSSRLVAGHQFLYSIFSLARNSVSFALVHSVSPILRVLRFHFPSVSQFVASAHFSLFSNSKFVAPCVWRRRQKNATANKHHTKYQLQWHASFTYTRRNGMCF